MLSEVLLGFEPSSSSEEITHPEALRQFNRLVELRRSPLTNVYLGLASAPWRVVASSAPLNSPLIWLQDMEPYVHLIVVAVLAAPSSSFS